MPTRESKVRDFMERAGQAIGEEFSEDLIDFRWRLFKEEVEELQYALFHVLYDINYGDGEPSQASMENVLKEMSDVQYTLSGMAVAFGLPLVNAFNRVHESNLTKFDSALVAQSDGKVLKGITYKPPFLGDLI
jgi:predicted HAD superfamily Cof-like phosphohydrolase